MKTSACITKLVKTEQSPLLMHYVRVNNSLKMLHLSHNNITNEGFKCFTEAVRVNTALEWLCIKYQDDGFKVHVLHKNTREMIHIEKICDCICEDLNFSI